MELSKTKTIEMAKDLDYKFRDQSFSSYFRLVRKLAEIDFFRGDLSEKQRDLLAKFKADVMSGKYESK